MMHYRKGENIEQELTKEDLPFEDCLSKLPQKDFLWMHVKGGTKTHNVIDYAKNALDKGEYRTVVWSGSGGGVVKTVSCAEILKRSYPLHQLTRMDQITIEEHWVPQMDGLEPIVAKRKVPSLHILMTLDPIDDSIPDVQKPDTTTEFWRGWSGRDTQQKKQQQQRRPGPNGEGQSQRQRHQRPKQPRQGSQQQQQGEQQGEIATTSEQQRERQQRPNNRNRNRGSGEQRKGRYGNGSNDQQQQQQPQQEGQQDDRQKEQPQQSQNQRRPISKQKQQQQKLPSSQVMHVETASASSTPNTSTAGEPMES